MRYIRAGLVSKKYLPSDLTLHTFIFRIIWCNTATTNLILIKIKLIRWVSIDDLLYLNTITVWADSDTFHTLKLSRATDSEQLYIPTPISHAGRS